MLSTQNNRTTQGWFSDIAYLFIGLAIFYALWIGSYPLFTPDEGRYSEVAREMLVSGDYITPRLNGIAFLDKPILYYWLQAAAIKMFGLKEWGLRFWPAFIGIFGCLNIYIAGRQLYNRRVGILSCLMLATCPLYYGAAHYANLDLEVAVFVSSSLLFFIMFTKASTERNKTICILLAYVFASFASLTKGLIGIAFPIMIIGSWIIILNRWKTLLQMHLLLGLIVFCIIVMPWYILVQRANPQFFDYFFILQQFSRYLTKADFNNQTPFWFYAPIILAGFIPWSCFLLQGIYQHCKSIWQSKQSHSTELFILLWFIIIFAFFSIPKSKTIGYILPTLPAAALITGLYLDKQWNNLTTLGYRIGAYLTSITFLALAAILILKPGLIIPGFDKKLFTHIHTATIFLGLGGLLALVFSIKNKSRLLFISNLITISILMLFIVTSAATFNHKSIKSFAQIIRTHVKPNDEIIMYYRYFQDLPIYLERRITIVADWNSDDIEKYDNWQRELWYHKKYVDSSDWLIENETLNNRWMHDKRLFLIISDDLYPDFLSNLNAQTKHNAKIYLVATTFFNDRDTLLLLSNKP